MLFQIANTSKIAAAAVCRKWIGVLISFFAIQKKTFSQYLQKFSYRKDYFHILCWYCTEVYQLSLPPILYPQEWGNFHIHKQPLSAAFDSVMARSFGSPFNLRLLNLCFTKNCLANLSGLCQYYMPEGCRLSFLNHKFANSLFPQ